MKKAILIVALMFGFMAGITAQEYTHSIGGTVGNLYGVSYKGLFGNIAVEADLGVSLLGAVPMTSVTKFDGGEKTKWSGTPAVFNFTFEANPNVMYQAVAHSWGWGSISWYAGGGLSIGFITNTDRVAKNTVNSIIDKYANGFDNADYLDDVNDWWTDEDWAAYYGSNGGDADGKAKKVDFKFGLNAIGGAEIHFHKVPLAVSLDFRPGYGLGVPKQYEGVKSHYSFFDWKVVAGVRYTF